MRKVAPLEWIQFSERTVAVETTIRHKALLAKQNGEVMAKMSLLSLSGSVLIKTTLMKHLQRHIVVHPDRVLVKTSTDMTIVAGRRRDAQTIEFLSLYTSKVI